ncbi:MAG: glycosyltransferase [Chloroflexi bacterium]|nr:glycosyltransferase [Chloroflexota bacterium]MBV9895132.1 glycosyltransferase [Chloroflexota bacterium]
MTEPFISVVVPTYNRRTSLQRLLEALDRQTYPVSRFEVIVVDDGSGDGTPDFVRGWPAAYRLRVLQQEHAGPAAARNRGVGAANGELIVFLDDDVAPVAALLQQHVRTHEAQPNAVVIGPMSPPGDWPRPVWVRWEEEQLLSQYEAMIAGVWSCTARQFYTGNASLARSRFLEAGGFDTTFQRAEDVELGYRLHDLGASFVFNPDADVLHYAYRSFESWCRTPYQYGRYDVVMQRNGRETLVWALREFQNRNPLNRALVRLLAGRRRGVNSAVGLLSGVMRLATQLGAYRPAQQALSAIFGLLYWQGICEESGGRRVLLALNQDQILA